MRFQIIIVILIIIYSAGCTLVDRIEKKLGTQQEEPPISQTPPTTRERTPAKPAPSASPTDYQRLRQVYLQQQQQIQELEEQLSNNQITLRQLEKKLMTNFELMEHSVLDSLNAMERQIQQLTASQRSDQQLASQRTLEGQTPSLSSQRASNQKIGTPPQTSKPLIENYSLLTPKKQSTSTSSTITTQSDQQKPSPLRPVRPPAQNQIVDESKSANTQQRNIASPPREQQPFNDPSLNEPIAPYKLKSRPEVKKLYDQGMGAMINRKYQEAVQIFEDMLQQFPDDEYSDNAQFWLGHIHFTLNRLNQSQEAFQKVLQNYEHRPTSQGYKTPDAIYMLGKIAESNNNLAHAQYYFEQVINRFPNSTAASNAEDNLKVLSNRQ